MNRPDTDRMFAGSIPQFYESHLVPLIFEPYAVELARLVAERRPGRVLEIAAGTGAVTRHLARRLPESTAIVASDLNRPMLDHAAALGTVRPVEWRLADAHELPFEDASFDVLVCQFGAMFFHDRKRAWAEAHRVLRPGGALLFSVWDRIEDNEFAHVVTQALEPMFPDDPPRFLGRLPHGYHDPAAIARDLAGGGFPGTPRFRVQTESSRAESPLIPALAYCHGTPLRSEIEQRGPTRLAEATDAATAALARAFGQGRVVGKIQAHVVEVAR